MFKQLRLKALLLIRSFFKRRVRRGYRREPQTFIHNCLQNFSGHWLISARQD